MTHDPLLKKYQGEANDSDLGKQTTYDQTYNPQRLYPIPRAGKRREIGIDADHLPFYGFDCWNHYEVSWLNERGKPMVAIAQLYYDCQSPFIVESKSLKLYFNSFNNFVFHSIAQLQKTIQNDLEAILETAVVVVVQLLNQSSLSTLMQHFAGECLDDLDVECSVYTVNPNYLETNATQVCESLYSDLLKSNCLVTSQPDWGSVQIQYRGRQINREGLLRYIVSFRNHNEFHEQCIERIFVDIMHHCKPDELTVYGRYTRRGGLDINPYRSTQKVDFEKMNQRLIRQ